MIRKELAEIAKDDLVALCDERWLEDEQIDFKQTIPHKEGEGKDPWRDQKVIKDHGRDQLLATVIAFANSYGGDLVIGIREASGTQPGKAEAIEGIPACEDAAHRLAQMARSCIDPPFPGLQVRGVPVAEDGSGVIILRTQRSRAAPHRLITLHGAMKECFHRVRHETLAMTMRQIQDLTFSVARGLDAIDRRFAETRRSSQSWAQTPAPDMKRFCIRVATIASDDVILEHVHNVEDVRPEQRNARLKLRADQASIDLVFPFVFYAHQWRPVLRGSQSEMQQDSRQGRICVHCNGTITYDLAFQIPVSEDNLERVRQRAHILYPGWFFAIIVNAVESAHRFRVAAGVPMVDYGMEVEIVTSHDLPVMRFGNAWYDPAGTFPADTYEFPRYVIASPETWRETYLLVYRDFWNSIGIDASGDDFLLDPP